MAEIKPKKKNEFCKEGKNAVRARLCVCVFDIQRTVHHDIFL